MINLRAYAKWTWGKAELAAHEMAAVASFIEELIAKRPVTLDLAQLAPGIKILVGGIELAEEEITRVKDFVAKLKGGTPPASPPGPDDNTPPPTGV